MIGKSKLRNCREETTTIIQRLFFFRFTRVYATHSQPSTGNETPSQSSPTHFAHALNRFLLLELLLRDLLVDELLLLLSQNGAISISKGRFGGRRSWLRSFVQDGDELSGRGWTKWEERRRQFS